MKTLNVNLEITINFQDGIQKQPQTPACMSAFEKGVLETQFSKPLLRVSDLGTRDVSIERIAHNLREIQDGVQMAGRTLMQKGHHRYELNQEAAVKEALRLLKDCSMQISDELFPLLKRLSQRKNSNTY